MNQSAEGQTLQGVARRFMRINKLTITEADIAKKLIGAESKPIKEVVDGSTKERKVISEGMQV